VTDVPSDHPSGAPSASSASSSASSLSGPARLLAWPRLLLLLTLVCAAVGAIGLGRIKNEEDVLVFLPEGDASVAAFKDVARRFGALRVALIGVVPRPQSAPLRGERELFSVELLTAIDRLSTALKNTEGVDRVVSLSTMTDLVASDGGVEVMPLIPVPIPADAASLARLKARALALPQVRGNVVSSDGRAALVMVFFTEGARTRVLADKARQLAQAELGERASLYYGGGPFAGQSIYDDTQRDVRRLTPLAMLLFFGIVLIAFWDAMPVLLTVVTVGLSVVMVLGGMGLVGQPFTVVIGTLPLILFASGSQYAIHILGRYYLLRAEQPQASTLSAARGALRVAGPPVTVAALNCCVGFLSFLIMNIGAMRTFGIACACGVGFCWLLSVTVLPAVVARWQQRGGVPRARFTELGGVLTSGFYWVRRHRLLVVVVTGALAAIGAVGLSRVTVRMEPRAFFRPGSEPAEAQRFLDSEFGGAQFVQLVLDGDLGDPRTLAEVRRLGAFARSLPGVTQVQSIVQPLSMVNAAMAGMRGLPAEKAQVSTLLFFVEGEPSLKMLLTLDRRAALLHVRVLGEAQPVLDALNHYLKERWPFALRRPTNDELTEELTWLLPQQARDAKRPAVRAAVERIQGAGLTLAGALPPPAAPAAAAGPGAGGSDPARGEDGQGPDPAAQEAARLEAAQRQASKLLLAALGPASEHLPGLAADEVAASVELVATNLLAPPADPPASGATLRGQVTGEPVLDQAFSRAVDHNQWASLALALLSVLVVLLVAQRSLWSAILSVLPAMMALLVVFGFLGLSGQPIDLGTSLVGSIVTSSGADFAMHYIWYLRRRPAAQVVSTVGPVIFTTAALLGLGMGVLMLGAAPPIRLFGGLSCAGMGLSAIFTFLLIPALIGKLNEDPAAGSAPH
jgi:predicted RND superfamily exporter protein